MNWDKQPLPSIEDAERYGFDWTNDESSEARLVVQRRARLPRSRVLTVMTPRAELEIYATTTGLLRLWLNGKEVK